MLEYHQAKMNWSTNVAQVATDLPQTLSIKNSQTIIGLAHLDLHSMGRAGRRFVSD
jgi:hypothetical protein